MIEGLDENLIERKFDLINEITHKYDIEFIEAVLLLTYMEIEKLNDK